MFESDQEHRDALQKTGFWGKQGAGCIFLARDSKRILLPLRSQNVEEPGTFGVWGGAIDSEEDPKTAVEREVKEESGYNGTMKLVPLVVFKKDSFRYHNFLAIVDTEFVPDLNWETESYIWVNFGEWPHPLHFGLKYLIKHSGERIKKIIDGLKDKKSVKVPIVIYRGVNSSFGDVEPGNQSIGIKNKLIGSLGPNYTNSLDIAKEYGNEVVEYTVPSTSRILELNDYDDVIRLYQKFEKFLPPNLAKNIKNSKGIEQHNYIKSAANSLRNILKRDYDIIKCPINHGDYNYLKTTGKITDNVKYNMYILLNSTK